MQIFGSHNQRPWERENEGKQYLYRGSATSLSKKTSIWCQRLHKSQLLIRETFLEPAPLENICRLFEFSASRDIPNHVFCSHHTPLKTPTSWTNVSQENPIFKNFQVNCFCLWKRQKKIKHFWKRCSRKMLWVSFLVQWFFESEKIAAKRGNHHIFLFFQFLREKQSSKNTATVFFVSFFFSSKQLNVKNHSFAVVSKSFKSLVFLVFQSNAIVDCNCSNSFQEPRLVCVWYSSSFYPQVLGSRAVHIVVFTSSNLHFFMFVKVAFIWLTYKTCHWE